MNNWFLCKIKYKKEDDKGVLKNITEQYLVDALSFTEAEARIYEEMSSIISGEFIVTNMTKSRITDVFEYDDIDLYHRCKVSYVLADEDSGKERKITNQMLVNAQDVKTAYDRMFESLSNMLVPFRVTEVVESPILEVFRFKSQEQRQNEVPSNLKPVSEVDKKEE
ncbi:DUF4494 domain-containing protein [Aureibacter tunicatorum]|uniref:DUF4494 domain-containing protein n=1 Tax=Aureibacter tunicatorum TaxID=866807 RepID=A0AAE3XLV4_9BACT|nr:DUF4494 domain-containing protein [Aureibacter tunicatorum]MDR6238364.1 hypothetical protein [Aureibacter tunicatorum]BDD03396.1 hypothetical protein AUTU_08790 [Aureibacter tunicatorum]